MGETFSFSYPRPLLSSNITVLLATRTDTLRRGCTKTKLTTWDPQFLCRVVEPIHVIMKLPGNAWQPRDWVGPGLSGRRVSRKWWSSLSENVRTICVITEVGPMLALSLGWNVPNVSFTQWSIHVLPPPNFLALPNYLPTFALPSNKRIKYHPIALQYLTIGSRWK